MDSSKVCSSPTFRNLTSNQLHSPKELKEKLRKDYKHKVKNSRNVLLNRFRGSALATDLRSTITNIYNDIFNNNKNLQSELLVDNEETKILEEIKQELIQEELDWCIEEYEKAQIDDIDHILQGDENVICPICQKNNFNFYSNTLSCTSCNISINTTKTLKDIKNMIFDDVERHGCVCNNTAQFSAVSDLNGTHIYLICEKCMDMKLIV